MVPGTSTSVNRPSEKLPRCAKRSLAECQREHQRRTSPYPLTRLRNGRSVRSSHEHVSRARPRNSFGEYENPGNVRFGKSIIMSRTAEGGCAVAINNHLEERATTKPFVLWHVGSPYEFVAAVAEADTFDEISSVRRRPDWRYQITHNGKPVSGRLALPLATALGQDLTAPH
jgi:hypothetical protein